MKQRTFTLRQIIKEGTSLLESAGIGDAALDAWYLMEYTAGISRAEYYKDPDRIVEEGQAKRYLEYVEERKKRIPLQHITGEQEFMGYPFYVNRHVLIPRQDTETLVEEAAQAIRRIRKDISEDGTKPCVRILDMCTGSGCILLSIMKMCGETDGTGCDISAEALEVARKNGERLEVDADWVQSDLFESQRITEYDIIVSNPPYIPTADIEGLQEEVRFHDPGIALDGGADGLFFYRRIIAKSIAHIEDGGYLLFEIGCDQGEAVAKLMRSHGYKYVEIKKDLSGLDRVVTGRYNRDEMNR